MAHDTATHKQPERQDGGMTTTAHQRLVDDRIGTSADVAVVDPETAGRSVGKPKRLLDRRS